MVETPARLLWQLQFLSTRRLHVCLLGLDERDFRHLEPSVVFYAIYGIYRVSRQSHQSKRATARLSRPNVGSDKSCDRAVKLVGS